jgi:hypothetical protein
MPIATAVWLIDNTSMTFDQVADFCGLHPLQVKGIADGDVGAGVRGIDPVSTHQLAREEIDKAEADAAHRLKLLRPKTIVAERARKSPRYTPVSKRQNRPDAIAWLVRNHPEVSDAQISKLLGTTKSTITSVRDRSHWNTANLEPRDPVGLGLCSQIDLDAVVRKAAAKRAKMIKDNPALAPDPGPSLEPTRDSTIAEDEANEAREKKVDLNKVFADFSAGHDDDDDDQD